MTTIARLALKSYPPSFRERYGVELDALVHDTGTSARTVVDLLRNSLRAWTRPTFHGDAPVRRQRRLQASVTMTWVAWCAGFLVAPAINRLLLDPPIASVSGADRGLLDGASFLFAAGWVLALVGALVLAVRVFASTDRARRWTVARPLAPAAGLGLLDAGLLLWVVLLRHGHPAQWTHPSALFYVVLLTWLVGFAAFVAALGLGPALTVTRSRPGSSAMVLPALLAVPVALCLAGLVATSCIAALAAGVAPLGWPVLLVGAVASVVALVSSARGARAALVGR
jgi:MFS family permease